MRIGFIDFRPDRGHAGNFLTRIRRRPVEDGHEVVGCWALEKEPAEKWCEEFKVPHFASSSEFLGRVDGIMIPASSDPATHPRLLAEALKLDVPIYIDKPLASSAEDGLAMLRAANEAKVPVFSSSALRFCSEVKEASAVFPKPEFAQVWGGWSANFDEFIVHPVELLLALMRETPLAVRRVEARGNHLITVRFPENREGTIIFSQGKQPYEFSLTEGAERRQATIQSPFFESLLDDVLACAQHRRSPLAAGQMLSVLKVIDAARDSEDGQEIAITWNAEEQALS